MPTKKHVLVYEHIPKCAGSTIHGTLAPHYDHHFGAGSSVAMALLNYYKPLIEALPSPVFISGHYCFPKLFRLENCHFITVVREPFKRCVSLYRFSYKQNMQDMSFEDFLAHYPNNFFTHWLGGGDLERAKENVATRYLAVGVLEHLHLFWKELEGKLGLPLSKDLAFNVTGAAAQQAYHDHEQAFRSRNEDDYALYDFILGRTTRTKAGNDPAAPASEAHRAAATEISRKHEPAFLDSLLADSDKIRFLQDEALLAVLSHKGARIQDSTARENLYLAMSEHYKLLLDYIDCGERDKAGEFQNTLDRIFSASPHMIDDPVGDIGVCFPCNLDHDTDAGKFYEAFLQCDRQKAEYGFRHLLIGSRIMKAIMKLRSQGHAGLAEAMTARFEEDLGPVNLAHLRLEEALERGDGQETEIQCGILSKWAEDGNYKVSTTPAAGLLRKYRRYDASLRLLSAQLKKDFFARRTALETAMVLFEAGRRDEAMNFIGTFDMITLPLSMRHERVCMREGEKLLVISAVSPFAYSLFLDTLPLKEISLTVLANTRLQGQLQAIRSGIPFLAMPDRLFRHPEDMGSLPPELFENEYDAVVILGNGEYGWYANLFALARHIRAERYLFRPTDYSLAQTLRDQAVDVAQLVGAP